MKTLTQAQKRVLDTVFFDFSVAEWWRKELAFQLKGYSVSLESHIVKGITIYTLILKASPEGNAS